VQGIAPLRFPKVHVSKSRKQGKSIWNKENGDIPPQNPPFFMFFTGIGSLRISHETSNEFVEIKESKLTADNVIFVPANEKHQSKNNSKKP
jgi:hypothetical protein